MKAQSCLLPFLAAATIFSALPLAAAPARDARPNILFIFTDDQSYRTVGCYEGSHPWVRTPNLDRLAAEGVRFTAGYAGTWCLPSRAMFLTGLQPHAIRGIKVEYNPKASYDPEVFRFWPEALRANGYTTGIIGKWHLTSEHGHGRAWDFSALWNRTEPALAGGYYSNQKIRFDGGPHTPVGGYSTDNYTKYAVDFIRREHPRPWFLWLCYDAVHGPYTHAERHAGEFRNDEPVPVPADIYPPRPDKAAHMRKYGVWKPGPDGQPVQGNSRRTLADSVRQYNRAALALDEGVGKVIQALKESGQLDNTLIAFTSDQGFAWGQHGFAMKVAPYDANLRTPFIVRMPGRVAQGKVCRHPVNTLDLVATFLAVAKTPAPWKIHGHDLSPIFKNPDAQWPHPVMMQSFRWAFGEETDRALTLGDAHNGIPWYLFLRQDRYKYIRYLVENEIEELYDLEADPEELKNLALEPAHQQTLGGFRQRLAAELKRTDAHALLKNLPAPRTLASRAP